MKAQLKLCFAILPLACAAVPDIAGGAADPKAETAALPATLGVLATDFNAERLAPVDLPLAREHQHGTSSEAGTTYTCEHHPDVSSAAPGKCPKCGMDLVPKKKPAPSAAPAASPHAGHK